MKPENSCAVGTVSSWTLQKEPDTYSFPHVHHRLSLPLTESIMSLVAPVKQKEQQGKEKPAAPWATALVSYSHLTGTDNSHSEASSLSVTLTSHHCKLQ